MIILNHHFELCLTSQSLYKVKYAIKLQFLLLKIYLKPNKCTTIIFYLGNNQPTNIPGTWKIHQQGYSSYKGPMFKTYVLQNHQLILYFKKYYYFMCMWLYLQVCVITSCMHSAPRHQQWILDLDSLNLKLQVIIRHHVSTGNQAQVLWNSRQCSFFPPEYQHNYI